jgi:hypothetical protein
MNLRPSAALLLSHPSITLWAEKLKISLGVFKDKSIF